MPTQNQIDDLRLIAQGLTLERDTLRAMLEKLIRVSDERINSAGALDLRFRTDRELNTALLEARALLLK